MGKKKFLTKNEFRYDLNPLHIGSNGKPHPAYITGKRGHKYHASTITHSRKTPQGDTLSIDENPDKTSSDSRESHVSVPFWQSEKQFGKEKLKNFKYSKRNRRKIQKFHRKNK